MSALGTHQTVSTGFKPAGSALPGPGPEELTSLLGYLRQEDIDAIEEAYAVARAAHSGQYRQSGEPYITHPRAVAEAGAHRARDARDLRANRESPRTERPVLRARGPRIQLSPPHAFPRAGQGAPKGARQPSRRRRQDPGSAPGAAEGLQGRRA